MLVRVLKALAAAVGTGTFVVSTLLTIVQIWPSTGATVFDYRIGIVILSALIMIAASVVTYLLNPPEVPTIPHTYPNSDVAEYSIRFGRPEDVKGINAIARMHFPPELILDVDEIVRWLAPGLNIFRVATKRTPENDKEIVVAYYAIFPLNKEIYEKLKNHQISEKDITLENFQDLRGPDAEAIYVLDIARHSDELVGTIMIRDLIRYMSAFTHENDKIQKLGTWAFTEMGRSIAESFGMHRVLVYKQYANTGFYEIARQEFIQTTSDPKNMVSRILRHPFQEDYIID